MRTILKFIPIRKSIPFLSILLIFIFGIFLPNISKASASTLYFCGTIEDSNWMTPENWYSNSNCNLSAQNIPKEGDNVITRGSTAPDVDLDEWTEPLSINATATGIKFKSTSYSTVNINITGDVTFNGYSKNNGAITGNVTFNGYSKNNGTITGNVTFNGGSYNYRKNITGNVTFNEDLSENLGTVNGTKIRRYTISISTDRDFVSDGPWTVIADGVEVDVIDATYDETTTFEPKNNGNFKTSSSDTSPIVTSPTKKSITQTTATLGSKLISLGIPASISERGIVYGTSANPTENITPALETTTGAYTVNVTGLTCNTTYHYRGYATNATGTAYSLDDSFTTSACDVINVTPPVTNQGSHTSSGSSSSSSTTPVIPIVNPVVVIPTPTIQTPINITPTLKKGSQGEDVKTLQIYLNENGYNVGIADGSFGPKTLIAVKAFQVANGLVSDGAVGPNTISKMIVTVNTTTTPVVTSPTVVNITRTLRQGNKGEDVKVLQLYLNEHGYNTGKLDGSFGSQTLLAVKAFQKASGLTSDGVVGPKTREKMK